MGATETVDLFFELINEDEREKAIEWTMTWRDPKSGERRLDRGTEWFEFRDGRISEVRAYHHGENSPPPPPPADEFSAHPRSEETPMKTTQRPAAVPAIELWVLGAMLPLGIFAIATGRIALVCPLLAMLLVVALDRRLQARAK